MTITDEMLSAYLDGELAVAEAEAVEAALAAQPDLLASLEALMEADQLAQSEFASIGAEPVPLALARAIQEAPLAGPIQANDPAPPTAQRRAGPLVAAAAVLALAIGGAGGFLLGQGAGPGTEVAAARGWLDDIADYHAVYANQVRHLVEVPAEEADHIETWLSATLGSAVSVPDLSAEGLSFEGARLLVAAGRPVAQLIYTDAEGAVIALCQITSATPATDVASRTIGAFDLVTFGNDEANFVVISDQGRGDLQTIAAAAATQV
ncbi:MAG: zf-HC2 domain-containing protein [Pseudomonadota bacterium]